MSTIGARHATAAALAVVLVLAAGLALAAPPAVDTEVPDLSLSDLEGVQHTLSERIAEGPVVLVFFRGAW